MTKQTRPMVGLGQIKFPARHHTLGDYLATAQRLAEVVGVTLSDKPPTRLKGHECERGCYLWKTSDKAVDIQAIDDAYDYQARGNAFTMEDGVERHLAIALSDGNVHLFLTAAELKAEADND